MVVIVKNGELASKEKDSYVKFIKEKYSDRIIKTIILTVDGDYVDVETDFYNVNFDRIRRITGYLVGTLDRFNDGKKAEEHDRVKHDV